MGEMGSGYNTFVRKHERKNHSEELAVGKGKVVPVLN
jgi:hypothetical protein